MTKEKQLKVDELVITWKIINDQDYISLTDIAKKANERTDFVIQNWMRLRNTLEYLGVWEQMYNPDFNPIEFDGIRNPSFKGMIY